MHMQKKREEFWDTAPHYGGDRGLFHDARVAVGLASYMRKLISELHVFSVISMSDATLLQ